MPDFFDFIDAAPEGIGHCLLGQPRRNTDARRPAQKLEQGPAADGVEPVEPVNQQTCMVPTLGGGERRHDVRQMQVVIIGRHRRPDQRHCLRRIADIVP